MNYFWLVWSSKTFILNRFLWLEIVRFIDLWFSLTVSESFILCSLFPLFLSIFSNRRNPSLYQEEKLFFRFFYQKKNLVLQLLNENKGTKASASKFPYYNLENNSFSVLEIGINKVEMIQFTWEKWSHITTIQKKQPFEWNYWDKIAKFSSKFWVHKFRWVYINMLIIN